MNSAVLSQAQTASDVYTDLSGIQAIRNLKNKNEALTKIAHQFESMMLHMMIKSMRAANKVFAEGNLLSSQQVNMYQNMLDDQLSLSLSSGRGMGIADIMVRQLQSRFGNHSKTGKASSTSTPSGSNSLKTMADYLKNRNDYLGPLPSATIPAAVVPDNGISGAAPTNSPAQPTSDASTFDGSVEKFVDALYPLANKAAKALGVKPDVLIAQSALETGWGQKLSAGNNGQSSFNFFNIKADKHWQGNSVSVNTLENQGGVPVRERASFRAYSSAQHSFNDYVNFVRHSPRYEQALQCSDPESFIRKLADAGYATDSNYADKVIRIMNSPALKAAIKTAADQSATGN